MIILDAIRRLFGGRRRTPLAARVEPVDMSDPAHLAKLVRAGDPEVTHLAGNLVEVAVRQRSADLLRALCGIPGYGPQLADYFRWHLIRAVDTTDTGAITWMLAAGIDPRLPHRSGDTALHHAGTAAIAKALLDAGADPNRLDAMGRPASACLLGRGAFDAVEAVLDAGGDAAALARCAATERSPDGAHLRVRMCAFLASLPDVKPWFEDLVVADPTAPWAMGLLARLAQAEAGSDVGDHDQGGQ